MTADAFRPYFGDVHPLLVIALIALLGVGALAFLDSRGWFNAYNRAGRMSSLALSAALATLLALLMIAVDATVVFPEDLNVLLPHSLLFYPVMAFVAEAVFHLLPLALLLGSLGPLLSQAGPERIVWPSILVVSCVEPIFQVLAGFSGEVASWAQAYVGIHVFVFNLLQLSIFKRYDFVTMVSFRLVYYLHWHIVWGYVRLQLLF